MGLWGGMANSHTRFAPRSSWWPTDDSKEWCPVPPEPWQVPLPQRLLSRKTTAEVKLERIALHHSWHLKQLLLCVAHELLRSTQKPMKIEVLGRQVPMELRAWYGNAGLGLWRILRSFPSDFALYEEQGEPYVGYLHRTVRKTFDYAPGGVCLARV
eukprot:TRINITY_DN45959_c0_g2_i1.p2 TRINITY_DN45959_c0_g2~~TRINITY_DN45959_c0_g2_i1.p2  ORF type:complete len:172 (-),score=3.08 TRINITY_DN45959_c0_g2_i1:372-839(-)